jgi:hypothetical protein
MQAKLNYCRKDKRPQPDKVDPKREATEKTGRQ